MTVAVSLAVKAVLMTVAVLLAVKAVLMTVDISLAVAVSLAVKAVLMTSCLTSCCCPGLPKMHSLHVFDALEVKSTPLKFVLCVELTL